MIKSKRIVALLLSVMLIISSMFTVVNAAGDEAAGITSGSLTITKLENGRTDEDGNKLPLAGVKFKIYKVDDDESILQIPDKYLQEDYDSSSDENYYTTEAVTGVDGKVNFPNLKLGRYLVIEAEAPINVVEKTANFLVDIPTTNPEGNGLIYDVEVTPKNDTVYGGITLTKLNEKNEPMAGVNFILQKKNGEDWEDYELEKTLVTNESGTITLEGLPAGDYRFIETKTLEGYILDNNATYNFSVSLNEDGTTKVFPETITVINEKPTIKKEIASISRDEDNTNSNKDGINSADIGDIISYKIVAYVPRVINKLNTFVISDNMDEGLTFVNNSISIKGKERILDQANQEMVSLSEEIDSEITSEDYVLTSGEHSWSLEFTEQGKEKLMKYESLEITYNAILNSNAVANSNGNNNKAILEYSNIVNVKYDETPNPDDTDKESRDENDAKVYTGGFNLEKHALSRDGELLGGAVFKIATSEVEARKGNFIKDADGNEIVLTTGNGANGTELGKVSYKGLSYGTYYLLEVQAPTYEENGEVKYYNLLKDPIKIAVGEDTYEGLANVIVNKKGTLLPSTGGMGAVVFVAAGVLFIVLGVTYYRKNRKEEV